MRYIISLFIILSLSNSAIAGVWINNQQQGSNGVDVTVNWSNASSTGKYRLYWDDDNTPFYDGDVMYSSQKPTIIRGLLPCTTYEVAVEVETYHNIWPFEWWSYDRDTPNRQFKTRSANGTFCNLELDSSASTINVRADLTGTLAEIVQVCFYSLSGGIPDDTECSETWTTVDDAYNTGNARSDGAIRRNVIGSTNLFHTFDELHQSCRYNVRVVAFDNGGNVVADAEEIIKTQKTTYGAGFLCFLNESVFERLQPAELISTDVIAVATGVTEGSSAVLDTYLGTLGAYYADNRAIAKRHKQLFKDYGVLKQLDITGKKNQKRSEISGAGLFLAATLQDLEGFNKWQSSLESSGHNFTQFLAKNPVLPEAQEILTFSKKQNRDLKKQTRNKLPIKEFKRQKK